MPACRELLFIQGLPLLGRDDLLFTIATQTTYPGWGYMLEQGATTVWEAWEGCSSQIHSCFTSIAGWFHTGLAGIQPDPTAPGFKRFIIRPAVVGDLTWVKASFRSIHGPIVSNWKRENGRFALEVTIPPNSTATIHVPTTDPHTVTESAAWPTKLRVCSRWGSKTGLCSPSNPATIRLRQF